MMTKGTNRSTSILTISTCENENFEPNVNTNREPGTRKRERFEVDYRFINASSSFTSFGTAVLRISTPVAVTSTVSSIRTCSC